MLIEGWWRRLPAGGFSYLQRSMKIALAGPPNGSAATGRSRPDGPVENGPSQVRASNSGAPSVKRGALRLRFDSAQPVNGSNRQHCRLNSWRRCCCQPQAKVGSIASVGPLAHARGTAIAVRPGLKVIPNGSVSTAVGKVAFDDIDQNVETFVCTLLFFGELR